MADRRHAVRPSSWEDQPVFRELFLAHAPPRLAALLRGAGRVLYEDLLEAAAGPGSEAEPRLDPGFGSDPDDGAGPGKEEP